MKSLVNALVVYLMLFGSVTQAAPKQTKQEVVLTVTEEGFVPKDPEVKPGVPTVLKITRKTNATCATQIKIADKKIQKDLPLDKEVTINIGKLNKGELRFSCGMDMITGVIHAQ